MEYCSTNNTGDKRLSIEAHPVHTTPRTCYLEMVSTDSSIHESHVNLPPPLQELGGSQVQQDILPLPLPVPVTWEMVLWLATPVKGLGGWDFEENFYNCSIFSRECPKVRQTETRDFLP